MAYDSMFCPMKLDVYSDPEETVYHALASNPAHERAMSPAAYDAVRDMVRDWFTTPGVFEMSLDPEDGTLCLSVAGPGVLGLGGSIADIDLPLSDLMLATAATMGDTYGLPPSALSEMLRDLADQIDAKEA